MRFSRTRLTDIGRGDVRFAEVVFGTAAFARTIILPRNLPKTPEAARSRRRLVREPTRILANATPGVTDPATPVAANGRERAARGGQWCRELALRD
jgi:hypothetical protein